MGTVHYDEDGEPIAPAGLESYEDIHFLTNSLLLAKITKLRQTSTSCSEFRRLINQATNLLGWECCKDLPMSPVEGLQSPISEFVGFELAPKIGLAPIMRAGIGNALLDLLPEASVHHLGLFRDSVTLQPTEYYSKLPHQGPKPDMVFILDPMLATAATAIAAVNMLLDWGIPIKNIKLLCVIASMPGLERFISECAGVEVWCAVCDQDLTDEGYITPGLGDGELAPLLLDVSLRLVQPAIECSTRKHLTRFVVILDSTVHYSTSNCISQHEAAEHCLSRVVSSVTIGTFFSQANDDSTSNMSSSLAHQCAARATEWGKQNAQTLKGLPGPEPTKKIAVITCMDARLNPEAMFGLELGQSHIIRVGGGRTPDALRSLIGSEWVLGTTEIMVVHHTDCGYAKAPNDVVAREHISEAMGGSAPTDHLPVMTIKDGDLHRSVKHDMSFLRQSPYVRKEAVISGWIWDTHKGTIEEVKGE